jgi:hypothetical protein
MKNNGSSHHGGAGAEGRGSTCREGFNLELGKNPPDFMPLRIKNSNVHEPTRAQAVESLERLLFSVGVQRSVVA